MENLLSIVIPTKNESANIKSLIGRIVDVKLSLPYEFLVVDDSNDNTAQVAKQIGCRVIKGQGKGLGQAIIDGIYKAQGNYILVMDADGSHSPIYINGMVNQLKDGYDMVIGSRYCFGGGIDGWTLKRRIISRVASLLAYPITRLQDNTSGFFAVRKDSLNGAILKPDSWKIMLEVLVKSKFKKVKEVPIIFTDRQVGESKFNSKQMIAYLKHLFKLALWKYKVLNFGLVGGIGFIVNMGLYYPLTLIFKSEVTFLGQHFYLPPFVISSFVAIVSNYHLNKVWTFSDRKAKSLSFARYLSMASITLILDMFILFIMVDYGHFNPTIGAMIAIMFVFIIRYLCAEKWIWSKKEI